MITMQKYICVVTGEEISQARLDYLQSEGIPENQWTSLNGANQIVKKKKGLFIDNDATLFAIVDNLGAMGINRDEEPETENEKL